MRETCILCKSKELKTLQQIKVTDINDLYVRDLKINVLKEFKGNHQVEYKKCLNCHLHFFSPVLIGSPSFYKSLLEPEGFYYKHNRYEFFFAKRYIKKSDKVLEIGSGSGHFAQIIQVDDYTGLEYNDKAIAEAKSNGIGLIKKSIEEFSIEHENEFDVVCSFQVLEHIDNPNDYIESSLKVLKKGGIIIFGVPSAESSLTNNINHTLNLPPHHITRWYNKTFLFLENIFNIELIAIENEPISIRLRKRLIVDKYTDKVFKLFRKKEIIISNTRRYFLIRKIVKKIINTFKISLLSENEKGEAVIVILKKK